MNQVVIDKQKEWRDNNQGWLKKWREDNKEKLIEKSKAWQKENKERAREHHNKWVSKNRDKINETNRIWRENNKSLHLERKRENQKKRRLDDPFYKMSQNIRLLISNSFRRGKKAFTKKNKTEEILGCSIDFFIDHILSQCPEGIGLENFGKLGYHIDHKIPLDSAKTEEEVIRLNHYTNLQPMFYIDNLRKSNKIITS